MIIDNIKYGISILPDNGNLAYQDGYRFGAYHLNLLNKNDMHIDEFFKTKEEIQAFVNQNRKYGK